MDLSGTASGFLGSDKCIAESDEKLLPVRGLTSADICHQCAPLYLTLHYITLSIYTLSVYTRYRVKPPTVQEGVTHRVRECSLTTHTDSYSPHQVTL